ncbi:centromere-associated protein K-domain-containing protein [Umbelopsis sp. PMI_123]|nr:centromere-associated protein K-domain-containing protein [Umbelopsis sp. PMI_123]
MSIQQSLLENALNRATKEAAKLRIDDIPRPVDSAEKQRHENLVELINQKRLQLQQLQKRAKEQNLTRKVADTRQLDFEYKRLLLIQRQKQMLQKEIDIQKLVTDSRENVDRYETLHELVAKRHLIGTTEELEKAYTYLQQELSQTKEHLTRQQQILQEHQEVRDALTKKLIEVETSRDSTESPISKLREEYHEVNDRYRKIMNDLHDFLDETYPPKSVRISSRSAVGTSEIMDVEFSLKDLLIELMNASYKTPGAYLRLEEGTYWPPYIETLIKARIVVRHPNDATKLKLEDYRL